jgi:hypothetical protein
MTETGEVKLEKLAADFAGLTRTGSRGKNVSTRSYGDGGGAGKAAYTAV